MRISDWSSDVCSSDLSKVGIDKSTIGFAIGLTTPYTLKFLWAPLVDRLPIPVLTRLFGQRRSWLFVIQALLVLAIWQLGASNPTNDHLAPFALWAIVVAFLSATQDIVIDASHRDIERRRTAARHGDEPVDRKS